MIPVVAVVSAPADVRVGAVVAHPAAITGAWEQPIGRDKVVGFDIEIRTAVRGAPKTLEGAVQRIDYLWITTFVRSNGRSERTFWSSQIPARFTWKGNHLVLNEPASSNYPEPVLLDLYFNSNKNEWRGRVRNEWYSGKVTLARPYVPHTGVKIIGDWVDGRPRASGYSCNHVALGGDSELVIWSDIIEVPGWTIYPNGTTPPTSASEWYGELEVDAERRDAGYNMLFFTGNDLGGALVVGRLNEAGDVFAGQSIHIGNGVSTGTFDPFSWHRTTPDCPAPQTDAGTPSP